MRTASILLAAVAVTSSVASAQQNTSVPSWSGVIGVGAASMTRYLGSDESRVRPFPFVRLEYRNRLYAGVLASGTGVGLGSYLHRGQRAEWQMEIAASTPRDERRGDALAGMGDRKGGAALATAFRASLGFLSASANVGVGLDRDEGVQGGLGIAAERMFAGRWMAGVSAGARVADERNMGYEFGVTDEQASRRRELILAGDRRLRENDGEAYAPGGGLKQLDASASLGYALGNRSRLVAFASRSRLSDEAAASSIVRARESTNGGVMLMYGF